jgi:hypothetical protein
MTRSLTGKFAILNVASLALVLAGTSASAQCQTKPDRVWLAGRYDGNRVIIYFDAVRFDDTLPPNAARIVDPVAGRFFQPVRLSASYLANFLKESDRFALGEEYDVLIDGGAIRVKLTTLVGTEGDEGVGNDSYIGALATVIGKCSLFGTRDYYVVRPHQEPVCGSPRPRGQPPKIRKQFATLVDDLFSSTFKPRSFRFSPRA